MGPRSCTASRLYLLCINVSWPLWSCLPTLARLWSSTGEILVGKTFVFRVFPRLLLLPDPSFFAFIVAKHCYIGACDFFDLRQVQRLNGQVVQNSPCLALPLYMISLLWPKQCRRSVTWAVTRPYRTDTSGSGRGEVPPHLCIQRASPFVRPLTDLNHDELCTV
jgi:hypothetical protein